jgi:hypothetical protein
MSSPDHRRRERGEEVMQMDKLCPTSADLGPSGTYRSRCPHSTQTCANYCTWAPPHLKGHGGHLVARAAQQANLVFHRPVLTRY